MNKLLAQLALVGDSQKDLAEKMGITPQAVNKKIKNKSFNVSDIKKIKELYKLTDEQVSDIFL